METVKNVAAVIGCAMTCISFLTLICKPIRKALADFVVQKSGKSETQQQLADVQEQLKTLQQLMQEHVSADATKQQRMDDDRSAVLCLLRNAITRIYYAYLPVREIPAYEYKNMILLHEAYSKEGGNTYVNTIVDDMRHDWKVLSD